MKTSLTAALFLFAVVNIAHADRLSPEVARAMLDSLPSDPRAPLPLPGNNEPSVAQRLRDSLPQSARSPLPLPAHNSAPAQELKNALVKTVCNLVRYND